MKNLIDFLLYLCYDNYNTEVKCMDYIQIISQLGFPIAACSAMAWYVKYITDKHREDTQELQRSHHDAENAIKEAITNNTIVMTRLCERLGDNESTDHAGND